MMEAALRERMTGAARGADLRLVPAALVAWSAGWWLVGAPELAAAAATAAWIAGAVMLTIAFSLPRARVATVIVAVAVIAGALVATTVAVRAPSRSATSIEQLREFEVVTTAPLPAGADRVRGVVDGVPVLVVGLERAFAMDGTIASEGAIALGSTIDVRGRLEPKPPGESIAGILIAERADLGRPPPVALAWGESLRAGFRSITAQLPGDGGALLTGLAIGDDAAMPPRLDDAMTSTSLSHLTAVSGANCAVVVGAALLATGALGFPRRVRLVVAFAMLAAFVVLVTPQPSVVRAAVMAAIALVALAVDRPVRGVPLLALAVLLVLAADPWASREFGFVLSVLATGGLLLVAGPLAQRLTVLIPKPIALLVAVPAAAQLACQPVIVLLNPSIPLAGIAANLLAGPAAPIATGLGLIACLLAPIAPPLAMAVAWPAWIASSWIAGVATVLADLPFASMPWPADGAGAVIAIIGSGTVAWWAVRRDRGATIAGAAALCWAVVIVGVGAGAVVMDRSGRPAEWSIAQCDVGQGDAVVLRSAGAVALVDAGPDPQRLSACLDDLGIHHLDLMVLTHFDLDHVGGVAAIIGRVDEVLIGPTDERARSSVVEPLGAGGAIVRTVSVGERGMLGEAAWRVLWPPRTATEPGNAASLVVRVQTDPTIVLLGDLGEVEQQRMLGATPPGSTDVVKVAHHGSADQSARLLTSIGASLALIGVGADNDYGHPTVPTLDLIAETGASVVRSDLDGLALVAPSGEGGIAVWRQRGGDASVPAARLDPVGPGLFAAPATAHPIRARHRDGGRHGRTSRAGRPTSGLVRVILRAVLGSHPPGVGRAHHGTRAVPRRSCVDAAARDAPGRRPEPRGERPGGRHGRVR